MKREEMIFLIVLAVNFLIAAVYLLIGCVVVSTAEQASAAEGEEQKCDNRRTYLIRFLIMIFCPVVGPLFFFCSYLLFRLIFWREVDLEDVIFSKERVKTHQKADEDRDRNMAPLEETLSVGDKKNQRLLMMNVIRGDVEKSLQSIAVALNSKDSETSHYAASVLCDELNDFRIRIQQMTEEMEKEDKDETEYEELLMDEMNPLLKQNVLTDSEQSWYVNLMREAAESLYKKDKKKLTADRYEELCLRLLEQKRYEDADIWCERLTEQHPSALASYTCRLKLYFSMGDRERFFQTLDALKQSNIVVNPETLELIRTFSS